MTFDYTTKFESFKDETLYAALSDTARDAVRELAFSHRLTFQEFRQVVVASRDLAMWGEGSIGDWLASNARDSGEKDRLLSDLNRHVAQLRSHPKEYDPATSFRPTTRETKPVVKLESDKTVFGMCPVASEKTVCCNLRTIDAVENCVFGCSYCAVQTFYQEEIVFDEDLASKLDKIDLEPDRFYHIGSGQASDSLAWGNKGGNLDALFAFARKHPRILLEFKTKSDNVDYIVENDPPDNIVCSWSLNTDTIVENEEHFTASLDRRIAAARRVADAGVRVAFHFHPMVHYAGWDAEYPAVARRLIDTFSTDEVAFLSMGSVTLIKPVLKKIRELGNPTKIHQMELVPDPHGKLTYPDAIKVEMFRAMHAAFTPWHEDVFMYLCMEKADIWEGTFGWAYPDNDVFERDFAMRTTRR